MPRKKTKPKKIKKSDFDEIKASITCPITHCIFNEPVKILINDRGEGGAVVEKEAYQQLLKQRNPCCPITRASIRGYIHMREIVHITTSYLAVFPQETRNQYQLGTMVSKPVVEVEHINHDSGRIGALFGFIMVNIILCSQPADMIKTWGVALMMLAILCGGRVGESFAEYQTLLANLSSLEQDPLDDDIDEQPAVMGRESYFFS